MAREADVLMGSLDLTYPRSKILDFTFALEESRYCLFFFLFFFFLSSFSFICTCSSGNKHGIVCVCYRQRRWRVNGCSENRQTFDKFYSQNKFFYYLFIHFKIAIFGIIAVPSLKRHLRSSFSKGMTGNRQAPKHSLSGNKQNTEVGFWGTSTSYWCLSIASHPVSISYHSLKFLTISTAKYKKTSTFLFKLFSASTFPLQKKNILKLLKRFINV